MSSLALIVPEVEYRILWSSALAFVAQFRVGALRALVTARRWWISGIEMLALGVLVAVGAYTTGAGVAAAIV